MASSVGRPTKRSAASVATTWTSWPASTRARTTPTALYAAIPPAMPTTTVRRPSSPFVIAEAEVRSAAERLHDELVLVDLVEGDRERLVVDGGVDQRADVVEQRPLVEVGVVVVDLTRALRGEDDQGVLGLHLGEELVDGRVDDAG